MAAPLRFSIITPSYKQPEWLMLCARSIADQSGDGIQIEHIVQDSLSGPEVAAAVQGLPHLRLESEKDNGMYDAINRGWDKASGDIVAWLNCDEEYLPGTLNEVAVFFRDHPDVEVLFADAIVVDPEGKYLCSRQVLVPHLYHTWTCHLQTFSCSMFMRRRLLQEHRLRFDTHWKASGDADLVMRMIRAGVKMACLGRFTSTFVDTGENLGMHSSAQKESVELRSRAPGWVRALRPAWQGLHRLRRWSHGHYSPKPLAYDIFTRQSPGERVHFEVTQPTFYWAARMG